MSGFDTYNREWVDEKLGELRYLRACIHEWAGKDMPGTEAMQHFRELAAELREQQSAYAKWRAEPFPRAELIFKYQFGAKRQ